MVKRISFLKYKVGHQFYIVPTIQITYDKRLNGKYSIDLLWGRWGISMAW